MLVSPNEAIRLANGSVVQGRDALGLLLDTQKYASKKCSNCYGRGIVTLVKPVAKEAVEKYLEKHPENDGLFHQKEPGKYTTSQSTQCGCMRKKYIASYNAFANALVANNLAKEETSVNNKKTYVLV